MEIRKMAEMRKASPPFLVSAIKKWYYKKKESIMDSMQCSEKVLLQ
jgi:hypothetical protein